MRPVLTDCVPDMILPPEAERRAATAGGTLDDHDRWMAHWPAMQTLELRQPPRTLPPPRHLTVAAWNMERCKRVEDSADLLRREGADVVLATEMDLGMARSGQRHTARDLAEALGFGYVWGVEFVELGTGDPVETAAFAGVPNRAGLHGNAILSRYPLIDPALVPLDPGGAWFASSPKADGQYRVGGRMALLAGIATARGPVTVAAVHFESESTPETRAGSFRILLDGIAAHAGPGPCVIGGDLNTAALQPLTAAERLADPAAHEPCFAVAEAAGFGWRQSNTGAPTTRAAPGRLPLYPLVALDWILARDLPACHPRVVPALSARGEYLSDHEPVLAGFPL